MSRRRRGWFAGACLALGISTFAPGCGPKTARQPAPAAGPASGSEPARNPTSCADKTDGWWCVSTEPGYMAYCKGKTTAGGCPCATCTTAGVPATCSNPPPPAACE